MKQFFLHVPKTAGTSVKQLLRESFLETYCKSDPFSMFFYQSFLNCFRLIDGHVALYLVQAINSQRRVKSILRNPLDRCISFLNHIFSEDGHPDHRFLTMGYPLERFVDQSFDLDNLQTRMLGFSVSNNISAAINAGDHRAFHSATCEYYSSIVDDAMLEVALSNLETLDVALFDYLGISLIQLFDFTGDISLPHLRAPGMRKEYSQEIIDTICARTGSTTHSLRRPRRVQSSVCRTIFSRIQTLRRSLRTLSPAPAHSLKPAH